MDISVIIPTYKPKDYLWTCLDSLNKQTLNKGQFEVLLILNGCDEPYRSQISEYISNNLNGLTIRLIQTSTSGVSNARNIGIEQSAGSYIAFIDDDDYVSPTFLQDMLDKAKPGSVVLSNSISFIDGSDQFDENYSIRKTYESLSARRNIDLLHASAMVNGPCMKLLDSSFIQGVGFNTSFTNGEDSLFMFEISKNFKRIVLASPSAIYYRRIRENSATTNQKPLSYTIANNIRLIIAYSKCAIRHPFSYNIPFYFSRVLAGVKNMFIN